MPHLNRLADEFSSKGVRFLSVSSEKKDWVGKFLKKRKLEAWIGIDSDGSMFRDYGVKGIPATFIVDRKGRVVLRTHPSRLTRETLGAIVEGTYVPPPPEDTREPASASGSKGAPRSIGDFFRLEDGFRPGFDPVWDPPELRDRTAPSPYLKILRPTLFEKSLWSGGFGTSNAGAWHGATFVGVDATTLRVADPSKLIRGDTIDRANDPAAKSYLSLGEIARMLESSGERVVRLTDGVAHEESRGPIECLRVRKKPS